MTVHSLNAFLINVPPCVGNQEVLPSDTFNIHGLPCVREGRLLAPDPCRSCVEAVSAADGERFIVPGPDLYAMAVEPAEQVGIELEDESLFYQRG